MNKEEILQKARTENKGNDEFRRSLEGTTGRYRGVIAVLLALILTIFDNYLWKTGLIGAAAYLVYAAAEASSSWILWKYLKDRGELAKASLLTITALVAVAILIIRASKI